MTYTLNYGKVNLSTTVKKNFTEFTKKSLSIIEEGILALNLSDLRRLRERIDMTQQEMAERLGTTKVTISNWEAAPEKLSMDKLQQYLEIVGAEISDFETKSRGNSMNIKVNTEMMKFRTDLITAFKQLSKSVSYITKDGKSTKSFEGIYNSTMSDLRKLQFESRKIRVLIVGPSDSGKSTFINKMLGEDVLPAHWTPATSLAIKILHSSEKPEWMTGNTIIVKNDLSVDKEPVESWNLREKSYYDSHVQLEGGRDIVREYGEREGKNYDSSHVAEEIIFTYVDSEILNTIEIWDTPGTAAGDDDASEMDEQISTDARNNADAVIYLMQANSFMHKQDFQLLRRDIEKLPKRFNGKLGGYSNLFVVASQADIIDSEADRNYILQKGAERFIRTLSQEFFELNGGNEEALSQRFFTLSNKSDKEHISDRFNKQFSSFIENAEQITLEESYIKRDKIVRYHISQFESTEKRLENEKDNHERLVAEYEEKKASLPQILKGNDEIHSQLKEVIESSRRKAKKDFKEFYSTQLNSSNLRKMLDAGGYTKSEDDREIFANKISNMLSDEHQKIINKEAEKFKKQLFDVVDSVQIKTGISTKLFDYKAAVSGLVASGVTAGAFAAVATTISSNLGLYILVAQIGGLLTSAGIISSPTIAVGTVAAFGGPVGWVIGISVVVGALFAAIVGFINKNAWKDKFINSILEAYEEQSALSQYLESIDDFMNASLKGADLIKKGSDLAAEEEVKAAEKRAEATDEEFKLEIQQVGEWSKKFKEVLYEG